MLLLTPEFSFERGPLDLTAKLLPTPDAFLPGYLSVLQGLGNRLSPVHFQGPQSRLVICYELFKGRLLLSPPPSCLRLWTPFDLTLSRYLRDLNLRLGSCPFGHQAYPGALTPAVYGDDRFGV